MRVLFFLIVSGAAHFLAARWITGAFPSARKPRNKRIIYGIAAVLSSFLAIARLIGWKANRGPTLHLTLAFGMIELSAVVIALAWLFIVVVAARVSTKVVATIKPPPDEAAREKLISRREAIERTVGVTLATASTAALGWGIVRGRHAFQLEELVVKIPNLPKQLDGYVIAQVSDIHVGAFVMDRELNEGFELITRIRPDLIVATGDLVDFEHQKIDPLITHLERLNARDGIYAILGNHDHYAGARELGTQLRAANKVKLLINESVQIRPEDGGGFSLLGVDDLEGLWRGDPDYPGPNLERTIRSVANLESPRILLAHQPAFFKQSKGRVALQLSGHTHGGQINPGFRPASALMEFVAGRYDRNGSTLYVNRGFGTSGPPARIGAPPEVTKIILVSG